MRAVTRFATALVAVLLLSFAFSVRPAAAADSLTDTVTCVESGGQLADALREVPRNVEVDMAGSTDTSDAADIQTARAKIKVSSITRGPRPKHPEAHTYAKVEFGAVYSDDPAHENRAFWSATPQLSMAMHLSVKGTAALDFFQRMMDEDREMYLDFTPVPLDG